jgi:hypothetical protein
VRSLQCSQFQACGFYVLQRPPFLGKRALRGTRLWNCRFYYSNRFRKAWGSESTGNSDFRFE